MSSASTKYVIYECGTCLRQTQLSQDSRRPDPIHCNITARCRGTLSRIGERATKEFLFTPPVVGLDDYIQRGTSVSNATVTEELKPISISTTNGRVVLTLAALETEINGSFRDFFITDVDGGQFILERRSSTEDLPDLATITLVLFEIPQVLLDVKRYIYQRQNSVPFITGPDDSTSHLNLRFNADNDVVVLVNGIQLDSGAFDRSVDDKITFTPQITDSNNVIEVSVSSQFATVIDENTPNLIRLSCAPLRSGYTDEVAERSVNAWGDVAGVTLETQDKILLYCTDSERLTPAKQYTLAWIEATTTLSEETRHVGLETAFILLGREPFSFDDKEVYAYIKTTDLVDAVISYDRSSDDERELTVLQATINQVYNPIVATLPQETTQGTIESNSTQADQFVGTEQLERSYVIGPR